MKPKKLRKKKNDVVWILPSNIRNNIVESEDEYSKEHHPNSNALYLNRLIENSKKWKLVEVGKHPAKYKPKYEPEHNDDWCPNWEFKDGRQFFLCMLNHSNGRGWYIYCCGVDDGEMDMEQIPTLYDAEQIYDKIVDGFKKEDLKNLGFEAW